ncbi:MAG: hypothetical protein ISS31_02255 [Kiritimatiellae bacterium]|nr:hypothetical protein [Kiritimatiellia bacterium]
MHIAAASGKADVPSQGQDPLPITFSKREKPAVSLDALHVSSATKTATATKENPDAD